MKKAKLDITEKYKILSSDTGFAVTEAYKLIRTNIMFSLPKSEGGKTIAVTSSIPNEGKTTTAVNLAITFAQLGAKVVLIDCDLRKSRVHRYLSLERGTGISDVLCGFAELDKVLHRDVRENLDVITAGEIPPNPAELLSNEAFEELLGELSTRYDYVFIDTPPVTVVTDGVIIAKKTSGVVIIARGNVTTYDVLDETVTSFKRNYVNIIGMVMLDGRAKGKYYSSKYKYYKKSNYKYKYGDEPKINNV